MMVWAGMGEEAKMPRPEVGRKGGRVSLVRGMGGRGVCCDIQGKGND